jgi:hypothetical protein
MFRKETKMNGDKRRVLRVGGILISVAAGILYVAAGGYAQQHQHSGQGSLQQETSVEKQATEGLDTIYSKRLPSVQEALARAIQYLEAGHQQEALKELKQAQSSLEAARQALGKHVEPVIANDRCPIMGSKISADEVSADLTRIYNGKKVAFCCAGCPNTWDQLDDAQKTAKLTRVIARPKQSIAPAKRLPAEPQQHGTSCGH